MSRKFIKRDEDGNVTAVSLLQSEGYESIEDGMQGEVSAFLASTRETAELEQSDLDMVRVIDDLIEVLLSKQVFLFTELPEAAQKKLLERSALRQRLRDRGGLDLIKDDDII